MQSSAVTVDEYLTGVDGPWLPVVECLRDLCRERLPGYDEVMAYGMPTYQLDGETEVAFGRQARYLSLYVAKQDVLDAHRHEFGGLSVGKGCIRYRRPDQVGWDLVGRLLTETVESPSRPC